MLDASTLGAIELFTSGQQRKDSYPVQVTQQAKHLKCILADD